MAAGGGAAGLGLVAGALTDGMEAVIGTLGVAAMLLPHLAPKPLTRQLRNEHAGIIEEPTLSAPSIRTRRVRATTCRSRHRN